MSGRQLPAIREDSVVSAPMSSLPALMAVGRTLAASGYFDDARKEAQAVAKVLAGAELGLGPVASMTGIHIVKGRVTLSATLIAGLIKRSGRYDYRTSFAENGEACEVTFYEGGKEVGRSSFSRADAAKAGLWDKDGPWKQHPRNMLFARAMSNGAKWYCPDVFSGPVYTPDEIGLEVDGETGEVLSPPPSPPPTAAPQPAAPSPAPADDGAAEPISDAQRAHLFAFAKEAGVASDTVRVIARMVFGHGVSEMVAGEFEHMKLAIERYVNGGDAARDKVTAWLAEHPDALKRSEHDEAQVDEKAAA